MRSLPMVVALVASGCISSGRACPNDIVAGLIVTVTNASTGAEICDATVTATNGGETETLLLTPQGTGLCNYQSDPGSSGQSTLSVQATGFQTASIEVDVSTDSCGTLETRNLTVSLTPER